MNSGRWIQWPWPLPPGQENPVAVFADDEEAWENDRRERLRERELEIFGTDPAPKGGDWED